MTGTALADDPPADGGGGGDATGGDAAGGDAAAPPTDPQPAPEMAGQTAPSLVLGKGKILISGSTVNINLSKDAVGKPISFAPSVYYGISDKITAGITHDGGTTLWSPRPALRFTTIDLGMGQAVTVAGAAGICITGEEKGCPKVYDNIGADVLFSLGNAKFSYAAHGGLDVASFDPNMLLQLRVGLLGRFTASDKLTVVFDPRIRIGLTERDFNKEAVDVPVWVWFMANPKLGIYGHAGIAGPFDGFGDAYTIPVGFGASYTVSEKLTAGLDFLFVDLAGKTDLGADGRLLAVRVAYAL